MLSFLFAFCEMDRRLTLSSEFMELFFPLSPNSTDSSFTTDVPYTDAPYRIFLHIVWLIL